MMKLIGLVSTAGALLLCTQAASAHVDLDAPLVRYPTGQKAGPCGQAGGERTDRITVFQPGETITVQFTETIYHPGYFRVAFDTDGVDGFVNPANGQDTYNTEEVLLDHILIAPSDERGPTDEDITYEVEVTLPDVECDNCTLQLIQVMKADLTEPISPSNLYFRCADIVLSADGTIPDAGTGGSEPDAGVDPEPGGADAGDDGSNPGTGEAASGGCSVTGQAGAGSLLLIGLALVALRRRR